MSSLNLIIALAALQFAVLQPIHSFSAFLTENGKYDLQRICGKTVQRKAKIVGGEEANPREFPWLVNIKMKGEPHCGGALISEQFILTAAHCVASRPSDIFTARLGSFYLNSNQEEGVIEIPILKYHVHRYFNRPRLFANDVALIKIKPINFTDQIIPICLPSNTITNYENVIGKVAGFGWLDYPLGKLPNSLQKVDLPIISNQNCEAWFKESHHLLHISDGQFCAGYPEGQRDACKGDSGSPMTRKINNQTEVIGIVSAGIRCADKKMPGVYTKVSHYLDWIRGEMARI